MGSAGYLLRFLARCDMESLSCERETVGPLPRSPPAVRAAHAPGRPSLRSLLLAPQCLRAELRICRSKNLTVKPRVFAGVVVVTECASIDALLQRICEPRPHVRLITTEVGAAFGEGCHRHCVPRTGKLGDGPHAHRLPAREAARRRNPPARSAPRRHRTSSGSDAAQSYPLISDCLIWRVRCQSRRGIEIDSRK